MSNTIVYIITNIITNKRYIGQTTRSVEDRFNEHYWPRNKKASYNKPLYSDMRKYGLEAFDYDILENSPVDSNASEKFWIEKLNTLQPNGYNVSIGGDFNLDIDEDKIIRLYNDYQSIESIFKETGYSRGTIRKVLKNHNISILSSITVNRNKNAKPLIGINVVTKKKKKFKNQFDAAQYLIDNKLTMYKTINDVVSAIFRSINNGHNIYGFKWQIL